jgi:hypothetical protein
VPHGEVGVGFEAHELGGGVGAAVSPRLPAMTVISVVIPASSTTRTFGVRSFQSIVK